MGVVLDGFEQFEAKLRRAQESLGFVGVNTLNEVMQIGFDIATRECPKQTGTLLNSINWNIKHDSSGREIGTLNADAPYAGYVNFGTSGRKRTPFFSNAVIAMKIAVFRIVEKNLKLAMKGQLKNTQRGGVGAKANGMKTRKYLYQSRSKTGQKRYVYSKSRAGTVKFRGRIYTGRNYKARGERA